jgi:hypothetical protein
MAYRTGSVSSVAGTGTSAAVPVPTGAAAGDIVVVGLYLETTDASITAPAGFTLRSEAGSAATGLSRGRLFVYWKRLTGSDAGTYSFSWTTSAIYDVAAGAYSGRVTAGDPWDSPQIVAGAASTSLTTVIPSATVRAGGDLVAFATFHATAGATSWTPPSGMTERYDVSGGHLSYADEVTVDGATGTRTFTTVGATTGGTYGRGAMGSLIADTQVTVKAVTQGAASTTFTPTLPEHAAGDRLVLVVQGKDETTAIPTIGGGWTLIGSGTGGTGSLAADTGQMFWAAYAKDAASSSETAPTVTTGTPAPNILVWTCASFLLSTGKSWADAIAGSATWVRAISDTTTATPLTGTSASFSPQPTTGDLVFAAGGMPTDGNTNLTAASMSATGLSGGITPIGNGTDQRIVTGTNFDCSAYWAWWGGFTGTASSGVTASISTSTALNLSGVIVVASMRQQTGSAGSDLTGAATTVNPTAAGSLTGFNASAVTGAATTVLPAAVGVLLCASLLTGSPTTVNPTASGSLTSPATAINGAATTVNPTAAGVLDSTAGVTVTGGPTTVNPAAAGSLTVAPLSGTLTGAATTVNPTAAGSLDVASTDTFTCLDLDDVHIAFYATHTGGEIVPTSDTNGPLLVLPSPLMESGAEYDLRLGFSGGHYADGDVDGLLQVFATGNATGSGDNLIIHGGDFGPHSAETIVSLTAADTEAALAAGFPYIYLMIPEGTTVTSICWDQTAEPPPDPTDEIVEVDPVETDQDIVETDPVDTAAHEDDWHTWGTVTTPPVALPVAWDVAEAFSDVDLSGFQPSYTVSRARQVRDRDVIFIDGVDVTYYNGHRTATPDFQLVQPFSYGVGTLKFSRRQIHPLYQNLSAITWLRKGARILVGRIDGEGDVTIDYRGRLGAWDITGDELSVPLGGMFAGPASHKFRPIVPVRRRADANYWLHAMFRRVRQPLDRDDFGIELITPSSGMIYDCALNVVAQSVKKSGERMTAFYNDDVMRWQTGAVDMETIAATVYFDDGEMKPDLTRDFTAEVDEVYATAYLSDGTKILNSVWPGMQEQAPPLITLPLEEGDTGEDVEVLQARLVVLGYLSRDDQDGTFNAEVANAVWTAYQDADLDDVDDEFVVDAALWDWLWDVDATGYTTKEARILPLAQRRAVRDKDRSATGNIIGTNSLYDAQQAAVTVSATIDLGHVRSKSHAKQFARTLLNNSEPNWTGTLSTRQALIVGEHTPGDPITAADIFPIRDMRPGMNIWAPQFQGGQLFHVSTVSVSEDGKRVALDLDTRARDSLQIDGILSRRRENRTSPAKAFWAARSSVIPKDTIFGHDEHFGKLGHNIEHPGDGWLVYEVIAGDYGTVARVETSLTTNSEFAMMIFGKKVTAEYVANRVPNPLSDGFTAHKLVTITGDPTGGTFTLSGNSNTTGGIAYNAGAAAVQTAVRGLGGPFASVTVAGPVGGPYRVGTTESLSYSATGLTGGTDPGLSITTPSAPDSEWWAYPDIREDFEGKRMLYAAGSERNPCGYAPGRKLNEAGDASGHPLTGDWEDDATFPYRSPDCVFYVAVYSETPTEIRKGDQFAVLREEGT